MIVCNEALCVDSCCCPHNCRAVRTQVDDPYQEYCHCYVRLGQDKCVLIDTGCGTHDLRGYIDKHINTYGTNSFAHPSLSPIHASAR